jgi:hypothetical protein
MNLEEQVARIIDPTAYCMKPSAYGLQTEEEMLERTMVGPVRSVALQKAREVINLIQQLGEKT